MDFVIRKAETGTDWDNFYRMSFQTAKTTGDKIYTDLQEGNPSAPEEELVQLYRKEVEEFFDFSAPDARVFIVESSSGKYAGHIWLGVRTNEDPWDFKKPLWIYDIIVDPESRGHGLGKELLKYAEDYSLGLGRNIGLFVHEHNSVAIGLYKSQGYHVKCVPMPKKLEGDSQPRLPEGIVIQSIPSGHDTAVYSLGFQCFKKMVTRSIDITDEKISTKYGEFLKKSENPDKKHIKFVGKTGNGQVVGFILVGQAEFSEKVCLVHDFGVVDEYKQKGIGVALLGYAEKWAYGMEFQSMYYVLNTASDMTEDILRTAGYSVPGYFMEKVLTRTL